MSVTVNEFIAWLMELSEADRNKSLHCVQLCAGSRVEELRIVDYHDDEVCVDDCGPDEG